MTGNNDVVCRGSVAQDYAVLARRRERACKGEVDVSIVEVSGGRGWRGQVGRVRPYTEDPGPGTGGALEILWTDCNDSPPVADQSDCGWGIERALVDHVGDFIRCRVIVG